MKVSDKGRAFLEQREGFRTQAYRDSAGKWTTGVGHLITADEFGKGELAALPGVGPHDFLTEREVDTLFAADLVRFETGVTHILDRNGILVTQNGFDALVCLAYNIGIEGLAGSGVIKALRNSDHQAVGIAWQMWNHIHDPKPPHDLIVDPGLTKRRQAEILLFNS